MKTEEKIIQQVVERSKKGRPRGDCPSDEVLSAFIEGRLSEDNHDAIAGHLGRCSHCRATVIAVRRIVDEVSYEASTEVPAPALKRALKLDPAAKGTMEVVVEFIKGAAKIARMSENVFGAPVPAAEPIRHESKVVSETLITFTKEFPPYLAEIDVEKLNPERGEITLRLSEKGSARALSGIRVSLFDRDRELESSPLEDGVAVFENVKFGEYRIEIAKVGEPVGRVTLEMKGDGK